MARTRFVLLVPFAMVLCATSLEVPSDDTDERSTLEDYAYQLTLQCDSQIEEMAAVLPPVNVEQLRSEHYAWKIHRDRYCAEAARSSSDNLRELRCLAELTSKYFDQRELEISAIEHQREQQSK